MAMTNREQKQGKLRKIFRSFSDDIYKGSAHSVPPDIPAPPQDKSLDDALLLGLANHSNEFLNPWFFRQSISHEELAYALDHILNHSRLKERLLQWHKQSQAALIQRIREEVIGEKEFYLEHWPFVLKRNQVREMDRLSARDALRAEQREALTKLERELDE